MALEPPGERAARTLWDRMGHDTLAPTMEMLEICIALTAQPTYGHTWRTLIGRVASLGGAVGQTLSRMRWRGITGKASFAAVQASERPALAVMPSQRPNAGG